MRHAIKRSIQRPRGFSLLELMTALAIFSVAVAMAGVVTVAGVGIARNAEMGADANLAARFGGEVLSRSVVKAAFGAPDGMRAAPAGTALWISPVFGVDGTTGVGATPATPSATEADDLWLVVPDDNALGQTGTGSPMSVVKGAASGAIQVSDTSCTISPDCPSGARLAVGDILGVSNMRGSALIRVTGFTGPSASPKNQISYSEQGTPGFNNSQKGFQIGDMVSKVKLVHFFIQRDPSGRPNLMKASGTIGPDPRGLPFVETGTPELVQPNVEDLQLAYATDPSNAGAPNSYTWSDGYAPANAKGRLRAIRLTLIGRTAVPLKAASQDMTLRRLPMSAENHVIPNTVVPDGYGRAIYQRVLSVVNMAPENI